MSELLERTRTTLPSEATLEERARAAYAVAKREREQLERERWRNEFERRSVALLAYLRDYLGVTVPNGPPVDWYGVADLRFVPVSFPSGRTEVAMQARCDQCRGWHTLATWATLEQVGAALESRDPHICPACPEAVRPEAEALADPAPPPAPLGEQLETLIRRIVEETLEEAGGTCAEAWRGAVE